jgi:hypothetical protein
VTFGFAKSPFAALHSAWHWSFLLCRIMINQQQSETVILGKVKAVE